MASWVLLLLPTLTISIFPLLALFGEAFTAPMVPGAASDIAWGTLTLTLVMCLGAAVCATALGVFTGSLLGCADWPGRRSLRLLLVLPVLIPPYLHAIAWTNLLRAHGPAAQFFFTTAGLDPAMLAEAIHTVPGAIFIFTLAYFPLTMLMTEKTMQLVPPTLSDVARVYGASTWQTWRWAIWPHIRPAATTSALIVFLLTGSELGVPTILKVRVFNFEVFTQLSAFNNFHSAVFLCTPLLLAGVALVFGEYQIGGQPHWQTPDIDYLAPRRLTFRNSWPLAAPLFFFATFSVIVPLSSFGSAFDHNSAGKMAVLAIRPILNTYSYALVASLSCMTVSFLLVASLPRAAGVRRRLTDILLVAAFAVPGTIMAFALLRQFDHAPYTQFLTPPVLVVAALFARFQIVPFRALSQSLAQIPAELFETAVIEGAGPAQVFRHVMSPVLCGPALLVTVVLFLLTFNELGSTILLYPPGGETLPIALYSIEANSPRAYVACLSLITPVTLLAPFALISLAGALTRNTWRG
ncbi:MAG: iron ABC transporter permease [Candidatus Hydrogenedentes bacterium]|nr:iron ABC transporter permease [Candidatus Hydrogenedentota bacterium]